MVDSYVKLYKDLSKLPGIKSAFCLKSANKLTEIVTNWDQRELSRMSKTGYRKSFFYDPAKRSTVAVSTPVELNSESLTSFSRSGFLAIVRKASKAGVDKQYIEIWKDGSKFKTLDVLSKEKHANIVTNPQIGCLSWSPSENALLYVAEKFVKNQSFFAPKKPEKESSDAALNPTPAGEEFLYRQSWGEGMQDIINPLLFTVNVETEEVEQVPDQTEDISYGKAIWSLDGKSIVSIGWWNTPYKLGLIYCGNRRSAVFHFDLEKKKAEIIGASDHAVNEGLWFSPNGESLVYMQSTVGPAHRGPQAIIKVNWADKRVSEVVRVVSEPASPEEFPGIFSLGLPSRIWLEDNQHIVFHSIWRSKQELLLVNVNNGEVTRLTNDDKIGERSVLDVHDDLIVAMESAPNLKPNLVVGRIVQNKSIEWTSLESKEKAPVAIDWEILQLNPKPNSINKKFPNLDFEAILLTPKDKSKAPHPLVVIPHGGPHSAICPFYALSADFFCQLGCAVLYINYRGSLGFGENNVNSLLGNIGTQDVQDCQLAVDTVLEKHPNIDPKNVIVSSGSHGGYLALCLIGEYPDRYKRCIARNPVVYLPVLAGLSDIPDWTYAEAGVPFDHLTVPDEAAIVRMHQISPLGLVDKMKCPVLFLLGANDLRVPYHQGMQIHRALKARNIETQLYVYNDNHSLSQLDSESDCLIHMASWILNSASSKS